MIPNWRLTQNNKTFTLAQGLPVFFFRRSGGLQAYNNPMACLGLDVGSALRLAAVANVALFTLGAQVTVPQALARVSEEAAVFQENLPKTVAQETLTQKAVLPPSRLITFGSHGAVSPPKPRIVSHEVVSEYSVGHLKNSDSQNLFEFRQVVSVDGKPVRSVESARRELTLGIRSQDDAVRKRMLQDYAKFGLVDVASDYGLILLAFTKRGLATTAVKLEGTARIGADDALVLAWKQATADGGELEFRGRQAVRQPLQGTLWVRATDGLPLRIQAWAEYEQSKHRIRDEATVEYAMSSHGFLTPASVVHHHIVDGQLMTENLYRYDAFKLFESDSDIKFTEVPDGPTGATGPTGIRH